ncbi:PREDICTED: uncharacterized protein LOC109350530 [Lupinus angustifolius]|uniref:uncharacterized protein LOC109350530 n=1 Tax=Lupinus angustifolius TaxID=3871 RepID=UPI00092EB2C1|nr:PREDICTED: uncharacterized protein LOC109350530 [Lupinus angustifolius]
MKDEDTIADYFTKLRSLTNLMKGCGEIMKDQLIVEKVLRTLNPKFDHIVVAIEESKNLEDIKIEELQSSLEAHEQRIKERSLDRDPEQALQARFNKKFTSQGTFQKKFIGKWKGDKDRDHEGSRQESGSSSSQRINMNDQAMKRNKKKTDKKKIQCFRCKIFGHYASECINKFVSGGGDVEAKLAQENESDEDQVLLMVTTENDITKDDCWYLDTGCFNHMTGHKEWFISLDETSKSKVKFADHSCIEAEGICDISIQRRDGNHSCIQNVLYVPKMRSNLLSLGQLLEKGYTMLMEHRKLKVFDGDKNLILKVPLSTNRTFKIGIQVTRIGGNPI